LPPAKGNGEKAAPVVGYELHRKLSKCFEGSLHAGLSVHLEMERPEMDDAETPIGPEGVSIHNCPLAFVYTN